MLTCEYRTYMRYSDPIGRSTGPGMKRAFARPVSRSDPISGLEQSLSSPTEANRIFWSFPPMQMPEGGFGLGPGSLTGQVKQQHRGFTPFFEKGGGPTRSPCRAD